MTVKCIMEIQKKPYRFWKYQFVSMQFALARVKELTAFSFREMSVQTAFSFREMSVQN